MPSIAIAALLLSLLVAADQGAAQTAEPDNADPNDVLGNNWSTPPRLDKLYFYPCADCHEFMDANADIRRLEVDEGHPDHIDHGGDKIWCLNCHGHSPYNQLRTLLGEPVNFDASYRVCGGCHSGRLRDWEHGAHGKRIANWQGPRELTPCVVCHNPHHPAIAPRAPQAPPPVRAGLQRIDAEAEPTVPAWEIHREVLPNER